MDKSEFIRLKHRVSEAAKERAENTSYLDCDPESLSVRANEAEAIGHQEIADALRKFRDVVVNPLLGEGWTLERIEDAMYRAYTNG